MPTSTDDFPIMPQTWFIITFVHKRTFALDWAPLHQKPWETRCVQCVQCVYLLRKQTQTLKQSVKQGQDDVPPYTAMTKTTSFATTTMELDDELSRSLRPVKPIILASNDRKCVRFAGILALHTCYTLPKWLLLSLRKLRQTYVGTQAAACLVSLAPITLHVYWLDCWRLLLRLRLHIHV